MAVWKQDRYASLYMYKLQHNLLVEMWRQKTGRNSVLSLPANNTKVVTPDIVLKVHDVARRKA